MFIETDVATQIGTLALVHEIVNAVARAGDRSRRHRRWARHRGSVCARRRWRPARHRLSQLPRGHHLAGAPRRTGRGGPADRHHHCAERASGTRNSDALRAPSRARSTRRSPIIHSPRRALIPLRAKAEAKGSGDFSLLWAGQSRAANRNLGAAELTKALAEEALAELRKLCCELISRYLSLPGLTGNPVTLGPSRILTIGGLRRMRAFAGITISTAYATASEDAGRAVAAVVACGRAHKPPPR